MEVILLEKISGLGDLGQCVKVNPGYSRNYLFPKGKAVPAIKQNLEKFEADRAEHERRAKEIFLTAKSRADKIAQLSVVIKASVSEEGKLYGSVGTREIAEAITSLGVDLLKSEVRLPNGVFRFIGEFEVELQLHSDVVFPIKVVIQAE